MSKYEHLSLLRVIIDYVTEPIPWFWPKGHIAYRAQFVKMGIFRGSSWAHSQGTFRVRALGSKPRFWSTAKELQGTILYQYHGTTVTAVVVRYYQMHKFHLLI